MERQWVRVKAPAKLTTIDRANIERIVSEKINELPNLKKQIVKIKINRGRVYCYKLEEIIIPEDAVIDPNFIKALINGKYYESAFLRITIFNNDLSNCSLDWQRYNNAWMTISSGSLIACLEHAETSEWFQAF